MKKMPLIAVAGILCMGGQVHAQTEGTNTVATTPAKEPTIVRGDRLVVDYLHSVGTFEGNVLVVDPQVTLRADKMTVWFGAVTNVTTTATNAMARTVTRIEAHGGIVITTQDKKATGEEAVYTAEDGKVVLTGKPQVESPDGTVSGEKITFWKDQKRMDVESSTQLILYPDEQKPKDKKKQDEPGPEPPK